MQLPETATLQQATALLREVDAALEAAAEGGLPVDASALKDFDSSAVALLLHAQRRGRERGKPVTITGAPPKLVELARLYGVDGLLALE